MSNKKLDDSKRKLLKNAALSGGAVSLAALPSQWTKPIVASVILPAHAEQSSASDSLGSLGNCPTENTRNYSETNNETRQWSVSDGKVYDKYNSIVPFLSFDGTYITGGTSANQSTVRPGECTDGSDLKFVLKGSASAGSGTIAYNFSGGKYCGAANVSAFTIGETVAFNGSTFGNTRYYSGSKYFNYDLCNLLHPGISAAQFKAKISAQKSKLK